MNFTSGKIPLDGHLEENLTTFDFSTTKAISTECQTQEQVTYICLDAHDSRCQADVRRVGRGCFSPLSSKNSIQAKDKCEKNAQINGCHLLRTTKHEGSLGILTRN